MDADEKRTQDLEGFLREALKVELEDPGRQLTESDLKAIAIKSGLTEQDWDRLQERLQAHLDKGRNFLEFGNCEDAVTELDQAAVLAPYRIDVLYSCGQAHLLHWEKYKKEENRQRAVDLFEQCLRLEPGHEGAAEGLSHFRQRATEKKKIRHKVVAAAIAIALAGGGIAMMNHFGAPVPAPGQNPTVELPISERNVQSQSAQLNVQRSGNVIAIPRFSSVHAAFPDDLPHDIVEIKSGFTDSGHVLALRKNGSVLAWGANEFQQADVPELAEVTQIAVGWRHSLALQKDGTVVAWGDDSEGQSSVPTGLTDVIQISAGPRHSVALKSDGSVVAWGSNLFGQCNVPGGLAPVIRLPEICGDQTTVILEGGKLAAWGRNDSGEATPPNVEIGSATIVKLWAGGENYALLDDNRLLHWGRQLRSDQLPREMTGVTDVFSGYTATVLLQKTDRTASLHGAVKDHPAHQRELSNWKKATIAPSFIYGLVEEEE
ncbi:MAG: hypothetical protein P1U86_05280 [Verrucomicrobiales bacterium]|nr:hypothetical protein [Verrucomicrobiales bacterium]